MMSLLELLTLAESLGWSRSDRSRFVTLSHRGTSHAELRQAIEIGPPASHHATGEIGGRVDVDVAVARTLTAMSPDHKAFLDGFNEAPAAGMPPASVRSNASPKPKKRKFTMSTKTIEKLTRDVARLARASARGADTMTETEREIIANGARAAGVDPATFAAQMKATVAARKVDRDEDDDDDDDDDVGGGPRVERRTKVGSLSAHGVPGISRQAERDRIVQSCGYANEAAMREAGAKAKADIAAGIMNTPNGRVQVTPGGVRKLS